MYKVLTYFCKVYIISLAMPLSVIKLKTIKQKDFYSINIAQTYAQQTPCIWG